MGDQEMQFADPAWQPPQQRATQQEPLPQPVNVGSYAQPPWQDSSSPQQSEEPYAHIGSYTEGYRAQSSSGIPLRTGQQKRSNPWLWIVLALIIFSLLGGAFSRMNVDRPNDIPNSYSFPHMRMSDHFKPGGDAQQYQVGIHPTVVIQDPNGSITVNTSSDDGVVTVQTDGRDQESIPAATVDRGNETLNIVVDKSQSEQTLDVTVPNEADLVLQTDSGNIDVTGVNGQVNLTSDSGTITLSQVSLARNSSVSTNSGDIQFDGAIDPKGGNYQFQSGSGSVDVTLPPDSSFHAAVTPNSGSFNSDFPEMNSPPSGGTIDGNVGNSPRANVMIKTDSGSINLNEGS